MQPDASPLLDVLRAAPRRFRMPALPADAATAQAAGPETALAFTIEELRLALAAGSPAPAALEPLFTAALATLIRGALSSGGGDAAFQALVLRAQASEVEEFARLSSQAPADARAVRSAVDAIAHPGKLQALEDEVLRTALAHLHALTRAPDWRALREAALAPLPKPLLDDGERPAALQAIAAHPALARLQRLDDLRASEAVQRYLALRAQGGPLAGSDEAAAHGRASAHAGDAAEALSADALAQAAQWLDRREPASQPHRVVRSLRTPPGFPPGADKAKDEWDAALTRMRGAAADIVLLAEVKASPAAATPDFGRLLRGLQRLAGADADATYTFACAGGAIALHGGSLRALQPPGFALPPHVVYCCAAQEVRPPMLGAAARAVLLGEAASIAFAHAFAAGERAEEGMLGAVWSALATQPRLRAALHQYDTARAAREAMLHPQDLLAALHAAG